MQKLDIKKSTLKNGLTIIKVHLPSFHTVTNFLVIRSGSRYESPKINGIAHFLEHMVFKGTRSFKDTRSIAESIEGIGGYFNAWTSNDHTAYWNIVPQSQWRRGIQVAGELAFMPTLPKADLERERGVIIEEIRRMNDDPAHLVDDMLGEILFPDSPLGYSVIGTEKIIKSVQIEDFQKYHAEHYAPSQATFVVVGNLAHKDIDGEIKQLLGHLKGKKVSQPTLVTTNSKKALKVLNKKTDQTHFMLAFSDTNLGLRSQERFTAAVLNAVLGAGMSSRLFLNIREQKGLAYAIRSQFYPFEDTGIIQVYGGVNTGKIDLALAALDEEFQKLSDEAVTTGELRKAKALLIGSYDISSDKPVDIATWYGTSTLLGASESYEDAKELIEKVTAKDIQKLAARLLVKDRQVLAVIGPYSSDGRFRDFLNL
ncbi:MAG: pitrilysin family protein [Patescibacteria group bacterium]